MKFKAQFQPLEFFKDYFEDIDNGYWETEAQRDFYNLGEENEVNWNNSDLFS